MLGRNHLRLVIRKRAVLRLLTNVTHCCLVPQEKAVDENTRIMMYKMLNSGLLESIGGAIAGGKESVVFYAQGGR